VTIKPGQAPAVLSVFEGDTVADAVATFAERHRLRTVRVRASSPWSKTACFDRWGVRGHLHQPHARAGGGGGALGGAGSADW
jgi:hypothetical protein